MRERDKRRSLWLLAAAVAVLIAGGTFLVVRNPARGAVHVSAARRVAVSATARSGRPAPGFSLRTVDGTTFSLAAQRGRVVALDFLQAGCPSCAAEVPVLDKVARRFAGRAVTVLIVDESGGGASELRRYFRRKLGASKRLLIAADRGFRVAGSYRPTSMPAGFVIGRDGRIKWHGTVGDKPDTLVRAIAAARK